MSISGDRIGRSTADQDTSPERYRLTPTKRSLSDSPSPGRTAHRPIQQRRRSASDTWSTVSSRRDTPTSSSDDAPREERAEATALPVTHDNLATLESLSRSTEGSGTVSSSSSSDEESTFPMPKSLDDKNKLRAYNIHLSKDHPIPEDLKDHLKNIICRPRSAAASPHGKKLVKLTKMHNSEGESSIMVKLSPTLMEGLQGEFEGGHPYVAFCVESNLAREYLPQAPSSAVAEQHKALSQPQPDVAYGYIPGECAEIAGSSKAFDEEEETKLNLEPLAANMHLPFLTIQWKSPTSSQNMLDARLQGSRDGAAIVNHLFKLHERAGVHRPSSIQTSHMSITTDGENIQFHVHWRETRADARGAEAHHYHMEFFPGHESYFMFSQSDMEEARGIIKNITAYATDKRLTSIRELLRSWKTKGTKRQRTLPSKEDGIDKIPGNYFGSLMPQPEK